MLQSPILDGVDDMAGQINCTALIIEVGLATDMLKG